MIIMKTYKIVVDGEKLTFHTMLTEKDFLEQLDRTYGKDNYFIVEISY